MMFLTILQLMKVLLADKASLYFPFAALWAFSEPSSVIRGQLPAACPSFPEMNMT
jgi:hypothetical protein